MPKHLMTKLKIPESSLYMCPLRTISFYFNNIAELLWYGTILFFLHLYLTWGVVQPEQANVVCRIIVVHSGLEPATSGLQSKRVPNWATSEDM